MDSKDTRQPFKELKNVQAEKPRGTQAATKTGGVNRKSLIGKQSSIPKPPRANRSTARQVKVDKAENLPPPSRLSAKPKKTTNTSFRQTPQSTQQSDPSRRSIVSMNFTNSSSSAKAGLSARRGSQQEELSSQQKPFPAQEFDVSALPQAIGEAVKEVMKARFDEDRRAEVEDIVKKQLNANDSTSSQAAELLKLRSEILDLQAKLRDAERSAREERTRADGTESRLAKLQTEFTTLEESQSFASSHIDSEEHEKMKDQHAKLLDQAKVFEERVEILEEEIKSKHGKVVTYEKNIEGLSSDLKDAMFRVERVQTDLSCRESEVRRIKREKEELQADHEDLQETYKKRGTCLQEERRTVESLRLQLEKSICHEKKAIEDAKVKMAAAVEDLKPKIASLEEEKTELQRELDHTVSDLKNRAKDLQLLQEKVVLMESTISHLNCERTNSELKLKALDEKNTAAHAEIEELSAALGKLQQENSLLEQQAREDSIVRRKLHNTIQELKGNIRVFARVRPPLQGEVCKSESELSPSPDLFEYTERGQGLTAITPGKEELSGTSHGKRLRHPFKFDRVFDHRSSQELVFEEISQLVQSALDGYRVCIFAYGQTGSGKTYTMLGNNENGNGSLGMIPRSVHQIFNTAKLMEKDEWKFGLKVSFLEIYNEVVRDLLIDPKANSNKGKESRVKEEQYKIFFSPETRLCYVQDLSIENVQDEQQLHRLIEISMKRRSTAATKANERSSRSHSIFRLYIEGTNALTGEKRSGLLNLIDLAGSERLAHSKAEGERLRETRNINRSLSALGDVISALANKEKHVPFRNSKLTHVLQDSLGGDSKTLMFVNISNASESFHESLTSLRFAAKVNSCHVGTAKRSARVEL